MALWGDDIEKKDWLSVEKILLYRTLDFHTEIISHCVWLYFRFSLSFRDVEEMFAMRGVALSYETVREWCLKFGQTYANHFATQVTSARRQLALG